MAHRNARLTPHGRLLLCRRIEAQGWRVCEAASAAGISRQTASKWLARWRCEGTSGLWSIAPHGRCASPCAWSVSCCAGLCCCACASAAARPGSPGGPASPRRPSTARCAVTVCTACAFSEPREPVVRYCWPHAGDLVHLDTKRLGRIGKGGGKRFAGHLGRYQGIGWDHVHVAVDDATRLAYAEELADERAETAAAFLARALDFFSATGSRYGACSPTTAIPTVGTPWRRRSGHGLQHWRTRPYRPQTNGKAEAFVKIVQNGWAYKRPYDSTAERIAALPGFLTYYNGYRPHGGLDGDTPFGRLRSTTL